MPSAQKFCGLFIVRNNKKKEATAAGERGLLPFPPPPSPAPPLQSVSLAVLVSLSRHWLNLCGPKSFCTLSTRKELFRIKFAVMAAPVTHQVSSCRPLVCCYCSAAVVACCCCWHLLLTLLITRHASQPWRAFMQSNVRLKLMHSAPACRKTTQPATEVAKNFVPQLANSSCASPSPPSPSLLLCPLLCCCCASSAAAPVLTVVN